jgi:hypothetical protein
MHISIGIDDTNEVATSMTVTSTRKDFILVAPCGHYRPVSCRANPQADSTKNVYRFVFSTWPVVIVVI